MKTAIWTSRHSIALCVAAEAGVAGMCLGGATSEYPHFEIAERAALIRRAAARRRPALLVGIGGPSIDRVIELG